MRRDSNCGCRKPQPGMLIEIGRRFNVSLRDVHMVGDQPRDLGAAARGRRAAGAGAHRQGTAHSRRRQAAAGTQVFDNLAAFAAQLAP